MKNIVKITEMNAQEIRRAYLDFFKERGHAIIPRAQLVPDNDPTTLFTGSGMQPMIPFLLGEKHPLGVRLANSQTVFRSGDIEDVGDDRHTTFFEMLGNWSLGDYYKKETIKWYFEFLVDVIGLDPNKLYVTCFIGDKDAGIPKDVEAAKIWQELFKSKGIDAKITEIGSQEDGNKRGIKPGERIFYYDDDENWWSRGGNIKNTPIGDPCGPDSEVFYDFGDIAHKPGFGKPHPATDSGQFIEIGNNVFMGFRKVAEGKFEKLAKPNIDHGSGLERLAQAAINSPDMFRISVIWPIIEHLEKLSGKSYDNHRESMQVIADHLRGATFLAVDGVEPSNKEQGYVMRRLMRRAIRFAFELGVEQNFVQDIVPVIADLYESDYPEVKKNRQKIIDVLVKEEKVFRNTLRKGLLQFQYELTKPQDSIFPDSKSDHTLGSTLVPKVNATLKGDFIFKLYDTYGFPMELSMEEAYKQNIPIDQKWKSDFNQLMKEQRERSKTAAKGTFKGGLGGQKLIHKKYHTATHLMYESLRRELGDHVIQHGSNITEERLRFDFSHPEKVTKEQLRRVEDMVNEQIEKDLTVTFEEHPKEKALKELKPLGHFGDRYGDVIKIYRMQKGDGEPFSYEICGGPHVDHTGQLSDDGKRFKIKKEQASSAGIRRIKAVLA